MFAFGGKADIGIIVSPPPDRLVEKSRSRSYHGRSGLSAIWFYATTRTRKNMNAAKDGCWG